MLFNFVTLFPEKILSYFAGGIPERAIREGVFSIHTIQLRDFSRNKHNKVDDTVYGGGPGMLLQIEPIYHALESLGESKGCVILVTPSGEPFRQETAKELARTQKQITFLSGYYEGIDHRVNEHLVDREMSLGNYVLSSGDLAALCIADSISRNLPGFLGKEESLQDESHNEAGILEYPQYTKPAEFNGWTVPEVLLSGNHAAIESWRQAHKRKE